MRTFVVIIFLAALNAGGCSSSAPPAPATAKSSDCKAKKPSAKPHASLSLSATGDKPASYKGRLKAILDANCTSCHGKLGTAPHLDTFAALNDSRKAVMTSITEETMPKKEPLKQSDRDAFFLWKKQGYPETDADANKALKADESGDDDNASSTGSGCG